MPAPTESDILSALRSVHDPDLFKDLVTLHQVQSIKLAEGMVAIELSTASPLKDRLRAEVEAAVSKVPGVEEVIVNFSAPVSTKAAPAQRPAGAPPGSPHGAANQPKSLPNVKNIIAVGAGKGGVGKSTIAVNLAVGLSLAGKKVGLLDGDIYGPSIPTMLHLVGKPPSVVADRIIPFKLGPENGAGNPLVTMSIGFLVDPEKALIWRGPMAHGAMQQMLLQVEWGELDYLIVDLPPGTGDVSLTLAQTVALTGAVIVATPQEVALADARRAVRMFQTLGIEILGVVENMSYFVCEHGSEYDIFGRGGAQLMAQKMGLPFLGEIPIDTRLRLHSDNGTPFENFAATTRSSTPLKSLADLLDKQVAVRLATRPTAKPINFRMS
ncbi:MAG TPA: Mrp/NBP35 family ATP-binding protein [Phycisphaerae bacterium]|nr:Mrp/NBP35 family ATP-binding protein [Phycisphaerae bacterium]